ncbi:MAG: hypothetical protein MZV64_70775 [Ignavibacteriales bacterium]|nr:hypothetical protein [Ignavibacteriales bacterium]
MPRRCSPRTGSRTSLSGSSSPGGRAGPQTRRSAPLPETSRMPWGRRSWSCNQPGGGGAIGTKSVLDAPCDGYTQGVRVR